MGKANGSREAASETLVTKPDPESPVANPLSTDEEACKHIYRLAVRWMNRMLRLETKILHTQAPGPIHDFRVASRRFQQALDLLYPAPRPALAKRVRRKVKRGRRIFSEVRNCDVQIERVEKRLRRKRVTHCEAWKEFLGYLQGKRSQAAETALRQLTGLNLPKAYLRLKTLEPEYFITLQSEAADPAPDGSRPRRQLNCLNNELESSWRLLTKTLAHSQHSPDSEAIHRARIAGKRMRYLLEVFREFRWPGCQAVLAWLRDLQNFLGDWHDSDVAEEMMTEMLARPAFLREHFELASSVMKLIAAQRKARAKFTNHYPKIALESARGQEALRWVHSVLHEPRLD